jgi:hypothetical protein
LVAGGMMLAVVAAEENRIAVWNLTTRTRLGFLDGHGPSSVGQETMIHLLVGRLSAAPESGIQLPLAGACDIENRVAPAAGGPTPFTSSDAYQRGQRRG